MSRKLLLAYRFATEDRWNACMFASADRETKESRNGLRPFAPYGGLATRFETQGGSAPAVGCTGDVLWRDDAAHLRRSSLDGRSGVRTVRLSATACGRCAARSKATGLRG